MLLPILRAAPPSPSPSPSPSPLLPLHLSPSLLFLPPLSSPNLRLSRPSPLLAVPRRRRRRVDVDEEREGEEHDQNEDDEDDAAEAAMPFEEMRRWLERKPRGFGEGRAYDTAAEDRLLEEMERSHAAQLANVSKLRSQHNNKEQDDPPGKSIDAIQSGICVRMSNLPRKKNIHRDLQSVFKGFPGLINISPAVIANKKTRDPICKGFAFLYFESEVAAERFVQMYSKKNVEFGKVEKQIFCDTIYPHSPLNSSMQLADTRTNAPLKHADTENQVSLRANIDILTQDQDLLEGSSFDRSFGTEESPFLVEEDDLEAIENVSAAEVDVLDSNDSMPLSEKRRKQVASKKKNRSGGKQKPVKNPKLGFPGSVSRLKIKERTILSGVLSKYASKEVVVSSKEG